MYGVASHVCTLKSCTKMFHKRGVKVERIREIAKERQEYKREKVVYIRKERECETLMSTLMILLVL